MHRPGRKHPARHQQLHSTVKRRITGHKPQRWESRNDEVKSCKDGSASQKGKTLKPEGAAVAAGGWYRYSREVTLKHEVQTDAVFPRQDFKANNDEVRHRYPSDPQIKRAVRHGTWTVIHCQVQTTEEIRADCEWRGSKQTWHRQTLQPCACKPQRWQRRGVSISLGQ